MTAISAMTKDGARNAMHDTADSSGKRGSWLRGWRFQIMVLALIVLAGGLTYLARTVMYFPVDVQVTREVQSVQNPLVVRFLDAVAWVGFPPQSNYVFGTVILALFLFGHRLSALMTFFAAAGSAALWFWLSDFVNRPRPTPDLVQVAMELPRGGFPSGHVLNLTAIFGFLMYLAMTKVTNRWLRTILVALMALPIATIGIARVHAGAHWPSDVLGGYLIGGVWLALTIQLYRQGQAWLAKRHGGSADGSPDNSASGSSSDDGDRSRVRTDCWPTAAFEGEGVDGGAQRGADASADDRPGARPDAQADGQSEGRPGARAVVSSARNS